MREVHMLALFVHGALASLHTLGLIYNLRRRNTKDIIMHAIALGHGIRSARHHAQLCKELEEQHHG